MYFEYVFNFYQLLKIVIISIEKALIDVININDD